MLQDIKVLKGLKVLEDLRGLKEVKVLKELKELKVLRVHKVLREVKDSKVLKELKVVKDQQVPKAVKATAGEAGAVMGTTTSIFNPPAVESDTSGGIEDAMQAMPQEPEGESDLDREWRKMNAPKGQLPDTLE